MSLSGSMNSAVSGMNAQSNRLTVISDNIANSDTSAYKRAKISFSTFLTSTADNSYQSGGVETHYSRDVSKQGALNSTTSSSNIGINGKGFFVVQNSQGNEFLSRAGDFELDDKGDLVTPSGFALMGYSYQDGIPSPQINSLKGLSRVNMNNELPRAEETRNVLFSSPLDMRKPVVAAGELARSNTAESKFTHKASVSTYDAMGREIKYDIYFSKKSDLTANGSEWDVSIFRADQSTNGSFPYTNPPTNNSVTLTFDDHGNLTGDVDGLTITDTLTEPSRDLNFDFSSMKALGADFSPVNTKVDGHKPVWVTKATVDKDGTIYAVYSDGTRQPRFRIPLANVPSPDNLEALGGNVFAPSVESGAVFTGFPGEGAFGTTEGGKVENSNVDLATELTEMIQSQRNYTANSKAFQTGSELLDVLVNLKR